MIIYLNKEGRLGHQFSHFLLLMTYAFQHNRYFYYDSFNRNYINLFNIRNNTHQKPNFFSLIIIKALYSLLKLFKISYYKIFNFEFILCTDKAKELIFDDDIVKIFQSKSTYIITDFMMNDITIIMQYLGKLKAEIEFKDDIDMINFHNKIKNNFSKTIAIHIRRTDFKDFAGGRFYYNESDYKKILDRLFGILNLDKKDTAVIICSDENINVENFNSYQIFYDKRSVTEDFTLLKNADYIICSRSIFSFCASLLGDNLIYQIADVNYMFEAKDILRYTELMTKEYNLKIRKENII